jgi:uncharacterized protein (TIGR02118 family)
VVKLVVLLYRRPDLSVEAFRRHLRETHLPLVARMPGLRRLVVNLPLPGEPGVPVPGDPAAAQGCDGVGEDWFDSVEALRAALASPEGQAVAADAPNYVDTTRAQLLVVEEEEVPLPAGAYAAAGTYGAAPSRGG